MPFGFTGGNEVEGMPIVSVATPADLAALNVAGYENGQLAYVAQTSAGPPIRGAAEYVLQDAISAAPDGAYIVATADDPTRQWCYFTLLAGHMVAFEAAVEVDLKVAPQDILVVPRMDRRIRALQVSCWITATNTVTVAPTLSAGTNAPNYNNQATAAAPAGFTTQTVDTTVFLATAAGAGFPSPIHDLSAGGIFVRVSGAATATTLKVRLASIGQLFIP